jgi:hypothetical protein
MYCEVFRRCAMQPTLDLHPELHQVFNFAENQQSQGCCCFWKSKPVYKIDKKNTLIPSPSTLSFVERLVAEKRLSDIVKSKFENDPIENDRAFQILKLKINDSLNTGEKITDKRLAKIVNAVYELKRELKDLKYS